MRLRAYTLGAQNNEGVVGVPVSRCVVCTGYDTHIASAIINLDQQVEKDWPVVICDHEGNAHAVPLHAGARARLCMHVQHPQLTVPPLFVPQPRARGFCSLVRVFRVVTIIAQAKRSFTSLHGCCTPGRTRCKATSTQTSSSTTARSTGRP